MGSESTFVWFGERILERKLEAARLAIDDITDEAALDAAGSHWWKNRTGNLEENIVAEPAKREGSAVTGKFGSTEGAGFYGLFLERRTPFLRPAADRTFPRLAAMIRGH